MQNLTTTMATGAVAVLLMSGLPLGPTLAEEVDAAAQARRSEQNLDAKTKERLANVDKGPRTIDTSGYPAAAQERYQVFSKTCTKCHTLARPINSEYALPSEWARYVKRMMRKPGSGITKDKAKQIYEFLAYDSSVRKRELIERKMAELSPEERTQNEARLAKLLTQIGE